MEEVSLTSLPIEIVVEFILPHVNIFERIKNVRLVCKALSRPAMDIRHIELTPSTLIHFEQGKTINLIFFFTVIDAKKWYECVGALQPLFLSTLAKLVPPMCSAALDSSTNLASCFHD